MSGSDVLALVGDGVVSTDENGRVLLFNRAAEEIFGYKADEVLGEAVEMLIPERFRHGHAGDVQEFAAGTEATRRIMGHRREVLGRRKNSEEFPVEATVSRRTLNGRTVLTVVVRDISERNRFEQELEARNRALAASENQLRLALKGGRMGTWQWNLRTDELDGDAPMRQLWCLPGRGTLNVGTAFERIHPEDLPDLKAALDQAIGRGGEYKCEFRIVDPKGSTRWLAGQGAVLRSPAGEAETMLGVTFDVTERREIEEQRRLLSAELNHRMKNMMALVQSVVALTSRNASSVESYKRSLQGRLGAIAETQSLLMESNWSSLTLIEQLLSELGPYRNAEGTNVALDGPTIAFDPKAGLSVGLVFHELATNAAKYGALSVPTGRVEVKWRIEDGEGGHRLVLKWREVGGPTVSPPTRRGFGSTLIERTLSQSLGGAVEMDYRREGVVCRIELPLNGGNSHP